MGSIAHSQRVPKGVLVIPVTLEMSLVTLEMSWQIGRLSRLDFTVNPSGFQVRNELVHVRNELGHVRNELGRVFSFPTRSQGVPSFPAAPSRSQKKSAGCHGSIPP